MTLVVQRSLPPLRPATETAVIRRRATPAEAASPVVVAEERQARIHGLDAVRGLALLLGILLHGLMPYILDKAWMIHDVSQAHWPEIVSATIHFFRMILFVAIAGYFGRMMTLRRGARGYVRDRLVRIALPFVVFWPLVVAPLTLYSSVQEAQHGLPGKTLQETLLCMVGMGTLHLWFLWVLMQVILLVSVARWAALRVAPKTSRQVADALGRWLTTPIGVLLAALPTAYTVQVQNEPTGVIPPMSLLPDPYVLIAYSGAFLVGWLWSRDRQALARLARWAHLNAALAVVALVAGLIISNRMPHVYWLAPRELQAWISALAGWLAVYALLGLAVRHLTRERRWLRYLADASYWMYLVHLLPLLGIQLLLAELPWPVVPKLLLSLGLTFGILLLSYHCWVRHTWLGGWLNGRRHPRRAAAVAPLPAPAPAPRIPPTFGLDRVDGGSAMR